MPANNETRKISELTQLTAPAPADSLPIVDASEANVELKTKYVTLTDLFGNSSANVTVANAAVLSANTLVVRNLQTPANSTPNVVRGTIMFDTSYLYIATANNTLKRVALSSF